MAAPVSYDADTMRQVIRATRRLPTELRRELRASVAREVATPVARQISLSAGGAANPYARAFRSRGVSVRAGDEPLVVVGGPEPFGSHRGRMRDVVRGAEFGAHGRYSTYTRRAARRAGRKRRTSSAVHKVTRRVTLGFGTFVSGGRFVHPTVRRESVHALEAWARILERTTVKLFGGPGGL